MHWTFLFACAPLSMSCPRIFDALVLNTRICNRNCPRLMTFLIDVQTFHSLSSPRALIVLLSFVFGWQFESSRNWECTTFMATTLGRSSSSCLNIRRSAFFSEALLCVGSYPGAGILGDTSWRNVRVVSRKESVTRLLPSDVETSGSMPSENRRIFFLHFFLFAFFSASFSVHSKLLLRNCDSSSASMTLVALRSECAQIHSAMKFRKPVIAQRQYLTFDNLLFQLALPPSYPWLAWLKWRDGSSKCEPICFQSLFIHYLLFSQSFFEMQPHRPQWFTASPWTVWLLQNSHSWLRNTYNAFINVSIVNFERGWLLDIIFYFGIFLWEKKITAENSIGCSNPRPNFPMSNERIPLVWNFYQWKFLGFFHRFFLGIFHE